ncbi:hypothetical protein [uncultured Dysosmobacter sp.]|uniref:hypothetical protein n=1 Tax=uncultured Dysosmobacter sp. TaxID=2591384 RepID=UPI0026395D06|nr:hypothetical protein [uncultured Dysosmobacter sp.]
MYVDRADLVYADMMYYEKEAYGIAKCYYQVCLDEEKKKPKKKQNHQRCAYCERMIEQCEEKIREEEQNRESE